MQKLLLIILLGPLHALALPPRYLELVPFVQPAPDQGETATCWFMASTGVMELLLNQKHGIRNPVKNGPYDLSESFLIHQRDFYDPADPQEHFIEQVIARFNHGEAVLNRHWPVEPVNSDGTSNWGVWHRHREFATLPRISVPALKSKLLFARGRRHSTQVLRPGDIERMKEALVTHRAPLIVNYNDDGYWHVVLIVGFDDDVKGTCYEIAEKDCNERGSFVVRDSDGLPTENRAYNWFLLKGNAAAVVELK